MVLILKKRFNIFKNKMFKALSVILILFVVGYHFDDHYILESERVAYIKYFSVSMLF